MHDPYAVALKFKSKGKLLAETVGHLPKEISRTAWFFCKEKYRPLPIPKGGREIMFSVELRIIDEKKERFGRWT